jgi:hypothetical protein
MKQPSTPLRPAASSPALLRRSAMSRPQFGNEGDAARTRRRRPSHNQVCSRETKGVERAEAWKERTVRDAACVVSFFSGH